MRLFVFGRKAPFRVVIGILPVACARVASARERNGEK